MRFIRGIGIFSTAKARQKSSRRGSLTTLRWSSQRFSLTRSGNGVGMGISTATSREGQICRSGRDQMGRSL